MSKIDHTLFSANEHALEEAFGPCPECGEQLCLRRGKAGAFIGCRQYPSCQYSKPLHDNETSEVKIIEGSECPECHSDLAIKKGRYGLFIGCTCFPDCHYIASANRQSQTELTCPQCKSGKIVKRASKFGKNFYACDQFPKCRYAMNFQPVAHTCPKCEWPLMQEKKAASGLIWQCPQKHCLHKMPKP